MKKSTRKIISRLKQYVGHEMLRTKPTINGDSSYTDTPILLLGFTSDGKIRYQHLGINAKIFDNDEHFLPLSFTDWNWITRKKAIKPKHNELNKWRGQRIKRICPTSRTGDHSYMTCRSPFEKFPTLLSASKSHMLIMLNDSLLGNNERILRRDFVNPNEWVLAD